MRTYWILLLGLVLCPGCSDAEQQRQADQVHRQMIADDLRRQAQKMHSSQSVEETSHQTATDIQPDSADTDSANSGNRDQEKP